MPVVLGTRTGDLLIAVAGGSVMATARWLSRPLAAQVPNAIRLGVGSGYVATLLVGVTGLLVSVSGFARAAGLDVRPATVDGRRVSRAGLVTAVPPGWDDAGGAGAGASRILTLRRDQDGGRRVIGVDELVSGPGTRAEDAAHDRGRP